MIYLGRIRRAWETPEEARGMYVNAGEIADVIPWNRVPEVRRALALDRYRPHAGPHCLVVLRDGREIPSGCAVRKQWEKALRRAERAERARRANPPRQSPKARLRSSGWVPIALAAARTGYSREHLRLLAREGAIKAQKHAGQWWVLERSLAAYVARRHPSKRGSRRGGRGRAIY